MKIEQTFNLNKMWKHFFKRFCFIHGFNTDRLNLKFTCRRTMERVLQTNVRTFWYIRFGWLRVCNGGMAIPASVHNFIWRWTFSLASNFFITQVWPNIGLCWLVNTFVTVQFFHNFVFGAIEWSIFKWIQLNQFKFIFNTKRLKFSFA